MGLFESQIDAWYDLMPEDIEKKIKYYAQKFNFEQEDYANAEDLKEIFDYVQLLIFDRRLDNIILTLNAIKPHIENAHHQEPENDTFLEYLVEWNILAMRFVLADREQLAELPFYLEIRQLCEHQTGHLRAKELQTRLNIMNYYETWLEGGGFQDRLASEDFEILEDLVANTEQVIADTVSRWKEEGDISSAVITLRGLFRYYNLREKPNEAIKTLKDMLEILPSHPSFNQADLADVQSEIGMIFFRYKKFNAAIPYFENAVQIYLDAGEDYEMHLAQVESYLMECRKMLNSA